MSAGFEQALRIGAGHPALPGHFPGVPLVPGVVLLEQVALALRAWRGQRLARVLEAKFAAPLLPEETARLHLSA
ncbi:UNVERIFIED_ORG: hydroxymyristoyl-ACP dehydratase, partial [Rhodanobacter sp. FW104-R5]